MTRSSQIQHHYRYNPQILRNFSPNQSECRIYGITAKHAAVRPCLFRTAPLRPPSERVIAADYVAAGIWYRRTTPKAHGVCAAWSTAASHSPALTHQTRASSLAMLQATSLGGGQVTCMGEACMRHAASHLSTGPDILSPHQSGDARSAGRLYRP